MTGEQGRNRLIHQRLHAEGDGTGSRSPLCDDQHGDQQR